MPNGGLQNTILRAVLGKNGFHFQNIFLKLWIFIPNWVKVINQFSLWFVICAIKITFSEFFRENITLIRGTTPHMEVPLPRVSRPPFVRLNFKQSIAGLIPCTHYILFHKFLSRIHMTYFLRITCKIMLIEKLFWKFRVSILYHVLLLCAILLGRLHHGVSSIFFGDFFRSIENKVKKTDYSDFD